MPIKTIDGYVHDALRPDELASMQSVIQAVCDELGVKERELDRRRAVAERVLGAYRRGTPHPLNLVAAGLAEKPELQSLNG
jgi:hypothetical protein